MKPDNNSKDPKDKNNYDRSRAGIATNDNAAGNIDENNSEISKEKKPRCRFEMFVRLRKDAKIRFLDKQETFTFRGDRYDKEKIDRMLMTLLNQFKNHHHQYKMVIIYDTIKPKDSDGRIILKFLDGVMQINNLQQYATMLKDYSIPLIFKL